MAAPRLRHEGGLVEHLFWLQEAVTLCSVWGRGTGFLRRARPFCLTQPHLLGARTHMVAVVTAQCTFPISWCSNIISSTGKTGGELNSSEVPQLRTYLQLCGADPLLLKQGSKGRP